MVVDDEVFDEHHLLAEPVARRTRALGSVEGEQARLDLGDGEARHGAGELLGEGDPLGLALARRRLQHGDPVSVVERGAERVGEARLQPLAHDDAVHDDVDVVAQLLVECGHVLDLVVRPVYLDALEALLAQLQQLLAVLALAVPHHGGEEVAPRALGHGHDAVHHVLNLLRLDGQARGRAVGGARAGEEEAEVVVDLRHRADGRAGVLGRGLLLDGDGRGQATDVVHVRLLHHVEELAGVGRQRLDVAALALGVDRVEGEARLARPREPRDDHQLVAGDVHVDVLEVVLAGAADLDELLLGHAARASWWDAMT